MSIITRITLILGITILLISCQNNDSEVDSLEEAMVSNIDGEYSLANSKRSYVVIPWEGLGKSDMSSTGSRDLFKELKSDLSIEIKRINNALGYEGLKLSSLQVTPDWDHFVLVIRTFDSLEEADSYSLVLRNEMNKEILQKVKFIVPINYLDYRTSVELRSFEPYHTLFTNAKHRTSTID